MKTQLRNKLVLVVAGILLAGMLCTAGAEVPAGPPARPMRSAMYRVTVHNLTGGQPLTPPLLATHGTKDRVWKMGREAGYEVQQVAENGKLEPLIAALTADPDVLDVAVADPVPLVPTSDPGATGLSDSANIMIESNVHARYLSMISMLIATNDGFTGLNSMMLPADGSMTVLTAGNDAGTEINTEDFVDLVPPAQALIGISSGDPGTDESNPDLAEGGVVTYHPGVLGIADLVPELHGWDNPVAKITITRIDPQATWFSAPLGGVSEVPPVSTVAGGQAYFVLDRRNTRLYYVLDVHDIFGIVQSHIHHALPNQNGPVVAFLFGPVAPTDLTNGRLAVGVIREEDLVGVFAGDFEGFVAALRNGQTYVNVHTAENPGGEIRGQIGAMDPSHSFSAGR